MLTTNKGKSSLEAQKHKRKNDGKSSGHYREEDWKKRREDQGRIREKGGQVNEKKNRDFMGFRCRPNPAMSSDSGGIQVWAKDNLNRDNEL